MANKKTSLPTVDRKLSELNPSEYNPRMLTKKQHKELKESLEKFGAVDPLIINMHEDRKNKIIGGHQRWRIAQELGWETYPCVEMNLTLKEERELNVRLNKNTGSWDYDMLANFFEPDQLLEWGFTDEELFGREPDEDDEEEDEPDIEFSTELDEESNYVVLKFDKDIDWLNVQTILGIEATYSKRTNGKPWSRGTGRVLDGVDAMEKIRNSGGL